jgi:hypothetical protein
MTSIRQWRDQERTKVLYEQGKSTGAGNAFHQNKHYRYQGNYFQNAGMFKSIIAEGWPYMHIQYDNDTASKMIGVLTRYLYGGGSVRQDPKDLQKSLCGKLFGQVKGILEAKDFVIAYYPERKQSIGFIVAVSDDTILTQLKLVFPEQDGVKLKFMLGEEKWAAKHLTT